MGQKLCKPCADKRGTAPSSSRGGDAFLILDEGGVSSGGVPHGGAPPPSKEETPYKSPWEELEDMKRRVQNDEGFIARAIAKIPPPPDLSRLVSRANPNDASPSVRRAALSRSRSETRKRKKDRVNVHARFRGRHGVFAPPLVCEDFLDTARDRPMTRDGAFSKTEREIQFIDDTLKDGQNFIFEDLSRSDRNQFIERMELVHYKPNEVVIQRGAPGDYFYCVREGTVAVYISPDEAFGRAETDSGSDESIESESIASDSFVFGSSDGDYIPTAGKEPWIRDRLKVHPTTGSSVAKKQTSSISSKKHDLPGNRRHVHFLDKSDSTTPAITNVTPPFQRKERQPSTLNVDAIANTLLDLEAPVVECLENDRYIRDCGPGDTFGELALCYNCPRTATCITKTPCALWRIDAHSFQGLMARFHSDQNREGSHRRLAMDTLRRTSFLQTLDDRELGVIADSLAPVSYHKGERIIKKGEFSRIFYIITSGEVRIHDIGHGDSQKCDICAGPGECIGEKGALTGEVSAANVTVISDKAKLLAMSKEEFEKRLGPLHDLISRALKKKMLMAAPLIGASNFEPHEIEGLVDKLEEVRFTAGRTIAHLGKETPRALYMIMSGRVQVTDEKKGVVNILKAGCDFGGDTLSPIISSHSCISSLCIEVVEDTECTVLFQEAIESVIGSVSRLGKPLPPVASKLDMTIRLDDLIKHRIVGVGSFGRVWLVQHKTRGSIFALKEMDKSVLVKYNMAKGVMREKNIQASIDHPFIANLVATFQDTLSLYILETFIQGGELFSLMYKDVEQPHGHQMSNEQAQFYGACVLESLSHLHTRNIIYRDLKPENILLDSLGYPILIDFGFAKVVLDKTYTTCGSPEYLAPEVIIGKGHNKSADNWSFGVLIYEMLVGRTPFDHKGATQMSLFRRIAKAKFSFPSKKKHSLHVEVDARNLIRSLLVKLPKDRLGSFFRGDSDIKDHSFFGDLSNYREGLLKKQIAAPWVPTISNPLDSSYFDTFSKVETVLKAQHRKKPKEGIQELFRDF